MKEIINLQVGQCGNQLATNFWETILGEHSINLSGIYHGDSDLQLERIDAYFRESQDRIFTPRTILVDLDPGTLESIRGCPLGQLFGTQNLVGGQYGAGNNWAKGFYTEGAELIDSVMDVIRKETESCDCLQGFQMIHSIGGGTGSGMGTLIISKIKEEYPDKMVQTFSVFPSSKVSDSIITYNPSLAIHQLIENADMVHVLDNEALYNICLKSFEIDSPTYSDLNQLASVCLSGVTCSLRFPAQTNYHIRNLSLNLIPFPRLHFIINSCSPLISRGSRYCETLTVPELTHEIMKSKNSMCACDLKNGKCLSAFAMFRGRISPEEVDMHMLEVQQKNNDWFSGWIPDNIRSSTCKIPAKGAKTGATLINNSSAVQEIFRKEAQRFSILFKRKSCLHWYTGEGMDEFEFIDVESNISDLISEYHHIEHL